METAKQTREEDVMANYRRFECSNIKWAYKQWEKMRAKSAIKGYLRRHTQSCRKVPAPKFRVLSGLSPGTQDWWARWVLSQMLGDSP